MATDIKVSITPSDHSLHCDKCDGPCSIHILRRYASSSPSSLLYVEEDIELFQARADYAAHHWNEGEPIECNNPSNCPLQKSFSLPRQRSVTEEAHFIFCHHLPRLQSLKSSEPPLFMRQSTERFLALPPDIIDKSLSPRQLLQKTKSVRYQKLLHQQLRETRTDVLTFGVQFICSRNEAKWQNPKVEVLHNTFVKNKIKKSEWNRLFTSCSKFKQTNNAKRLNLTNKDVIGLKLYTDFDELQKELRKCFRTQDLKRQSEFFWWNDLLEKTYRKARDKIGGKLYHGVSNLTHTSTFSGTYYGPVSTTLSLSTATQFSGDDGMILELYSSYNRAAINLAFLSNYPDEKEILYMNTSFTISTILDPRHGDSVLIRTESDIKQMHQDIKEMETPECLDQWSKLQKAAEDGLKKMSVSSNILSLNHGVDNNGRGFGDLSCYQKVALLTLLYLQYYVDNDEENESLKLFFKCKVSTAQVLSNIRDQFITIANNITGVRMFYLTPLIEDYLSTKPAKYEWPLKGQRSLKECIKAFAARYKEKQPLQLQMIIRLFPTTKELILNGDNWDWSLKSFVAFLRKWHYDYSSNPLRYIKLKFVKQMGKEFMDELVAYVETQKQDELTMDDADLGRINYKFDHQKRCNSIGDTYDDEQAAKQLNHHKEEAKKNIRRILRLGWRFVTPSQLERIDSFEPAPELPFLLTFMENDAKSPLFYKSYTHRTLKCSSVPEFVEDEISTDTSFGFIQTEMEGAEGKTEMDNDDITTDEEDYEEGKIEIECNPKNCILTEKVFHKIKYGKQLEEALHGTVHESKTKSFSNACCKVNVLVLQYKDDPLAQRLEKVFGRKRICYKTIFKLFPNVTDIFLRQTAFDENECGRLTAFLKSKKKEHKFERIFYEAKDLGVTSDDDNGKLEDNDVKDDEEENTSQNKKNPFRKKLHSISWEFVENGQIAINKGQFFK